MTAGRRALTLAVLACVVGSAVALGAATRTWTVEVATRPDPLPPLRHARTGSALLPWLPALAVVALAGAGALLATRRTGRVAVGVLLVVSGAGVLAGGIYGLVAVDSVRAVWPTLCVLGGGLVAVVGALTVVRARDWPSLGTRYERRPAARAETDLWSALDRGEDPTADR